MSSKCWSIIAAAGSGTRMGGEIPKQYIKLGRKTVIEHSLEPFIINAHITAIVVVLSKNDRFWPNLKIQAEKSIYTVCGGEQRFQSVYNGLVFLNKHAQANDWILVHDSARPCLTQSDLEKLITTAESTQQSCILASPVSDTIKQSNANNQIQHTMDRSDLWRALTPQIFKFEQLSNAFEKILAQQIRVTDEAEIMENYNLPINLVAGGGDNIKITRAEDIVIARAILDQQGRL